MSLVMGISDHVHVLDFGRKIADGHARASAGRPGRDRGLPRKGAACHCSSSRTSRPATGRCRRCTACRWAVDEGEIVAVLGANGAGKTTTLRAVSGTVRRAGEIRFGGRSIGQLRPEAVARLGVAHVPGGPRHLRRADGAREPAARRLHAPRRRSCGATSSGWPRGSRGSIERGNQQAGTLSGGEQQMLALARAL